MAQQHGEQITPATATPHPAHHVARGFSQVFGLHPAVAVLTVIVDTMLFAGEGVTLGAFLPFSVIIAVAVGVIAYRAQVKFYHDDKESAQIKAFIVALLVAIPTPLPSAVFVPMGILGFFRHNKG